MQRVRMTSKLVEANPNMAGMPSGSTHWRVVLRCGNRQLTTFFSQGPAHCSEPGAAGVLDCLLSDMSTVECAQDFEDWASDMGYSTFDDYPKARRTYDLIGRQSAALRRLLGENFSQLGSFEDSESFARHMAGGAS